MDYKEKAHDTWEKLVAIRAHCKIIRNKFIDVTGLTSYDNVDRVQEALERALVLVKSIERDAK